MPSSHKHELKIIVNKDDVEWFRDHYPNNSFSWLFTLLLEKFREVSTLTPADYAKLGAEEVRKGMEES